jgi:hypothetical protein
VADDLLDAVNKILERKKKYGFQESNQRILWKRNWGN